MINGIESPILFPSFVEHSEIARIHNCKVVSAGMFEVGAEPADEDRMDINVWAGGKSVTLKLESRKEDADIIKRLLRPKSIF